MGAPGGVSRENTLATAPASPASARRAGSRDRRAPASDRGVMFHVEQSHVRLAGRVRLYNPALYCSFRAPPVPTCRGIIVPRDVGPRQAILSYSGDPGPLRPKSGDGAVTQNAAGGHGPRSGQRSPVCPRWGPTRSTGAASGAGPALATRLLADARPEGVVVASRCGASRDARLAIAGRHTPVDISRGSDSVCAYNGP
jgi:hypothetical protein